MTRKLSNYALIAILGIGLTGCASASKRLGLTKTTPNEFNILTKPPLVVPPEYNLRPPQVGVASSQNNYTSEVARTALLGEIDDAEPSKGEILFLREIGYRPTDEKYRLKVDGDNAVERKTSGFADQVLFWRDGSAKNVDGTLLNPELEAKRLERINSSTGGKPVTITRRPGRAKLPGL